MNAGPLFEMVETDPKQSMIDEVSRLMAELDADSCEMLLVRVQSHHKVMTTPADGYGVAGFGLVHASDASGQKPLCGQGHHTFRLRLVTVEEFEQIEGPKCGGCENSLKKLRGEKVLYKRENWLMESQERLIIAIYLACDKTTTKCCTVEELFHRTNYKSLDSLREALRRLKKHGVIKMKRVGRESQVRLALDCIVELSEGEFVVAVGKIYDAEKPKRTRKG